MQRVVCLPPVAPHGLTRALLCPRFCRSCGSTWRWMPPKVGGTAAGCCWLGASSSELSALQLLPRPAGTAKIATSSWPCICLPSTAPLSPAPRRHASAAQPLAGGAASRPQGVGAAGSRPGVHALAARTFGPPPLSQAAATQLRLCPLIELCPTRAPMQAQSAGGLQLARQGAPSLLVPRPAAADAARFAGCGAACSSLPQPHGLRA